MVCIVLFIYVNRYRSLRKRFGLSVARQNEGTGTHAHECTFCSGHDVGTYVTYDVQSSLFSYSRTIIVTFEAKKFIKESWFTHKVMLLGRFMQYKV